MMAFYNCSSLSEIHALGQVAPTVGNDAFHNVNATVYIPCGSRPSYAARWTSFSNFVSEGDFPYTVNAVSNDTTMGTVQISGTPTCDSPQVIVSATPNDGYVFLHWSDGDTASQRIITMTQDTALMAYFAEWSCDLFSVSLPYTADFTQCWTPSGGATVMPNGSVRLNGPGQKVTSPSIVIPDSVATNPYFFYYISRPNPDGSDQHAELDDTVSFRWLVNSQVHRSFSFSDTYLSFNDILFQQSYAGQTIQLELEYTGNDTLPIYLEAVDMYQYDILLNINGPSYANVGDTVTFSAQVQMPGGQQPDVLSWYDQDWNYLGDSNSIQKYWNTPGNYAVYVQVFKYGLYNGHYASADRWFYITVLDTTPVPPTDCDSISLPYTANFTQCWTATGGAAIVNSQWAKLDGYGQTLTSPWIQVGNDGTLFYGYWYYRDMAAGTWEYIDNGVGYSINIRTQDSVLHNVTSNQACYSGAGYGNSLGHDYDGQLIQWVIRYEDATSTTPVFFKTPELEQYHIEASITAPSSAQIGDTVVFTGHVSYPSGDVVYTDWYIDMAPDGEWHQIYEDGNLFSFIAESDSSVTLVMHVAGQYRMRLHASHGIAYSVVLHTIAVYDSASVDCDSISLPYTADFSQCWTAEGGATIIDPNHAAITGAGQKITSPWMQSVAGLTFMNWDMNREGSTNYELDERYTVTIESENGVIVSWTGSIGNWGIGNRFNSPGGRIRIVFEYTGSDPVPSLQINNVTLFQYDISATLEASGIAQVGDTVTLTVHATLQNGDTPDSYSLDTYNPQGQWMYADDPARTIVSHTDSVFKVVWHTAGRYTLYGGAHKQVPGYGYANATDRSLIQIVQQSFYAEDSIYYTSAAKDTVIGCHPQLHTADLPESVRVINDSAFFNLANLSSVALPEQLQYIGKMAFAWNQGITEITLPRGLQFVGDNAFCWDTNLAVINFNADNCQVMSPSTASDGNYWPVFIGCDNVTTINIGENVTRIPDRAFSYCSKLRGTLVIPDNVTYIGNDAFYSWVENSPTLTVVLGRSVSEIGNFAFPGYYGRVNHVISLNPIPPTLQEASFYTMPDSSRATVPCGSTEAYRNGAYWNEFIIEEDCTGIGDEPSADVFTVTVIDGRIVIEGVCEKTVSVFDIMGRHVVTKAAEGNVVSISALPTGVYMVKIGILPAHKAVVIR